MPDDCVELFVGGFGSYGLIRSWQKGARHF